MLHILTHFIVKFEQLKILFFVIPIKLKIINMIPVRKFKIAVFLLLFLGIDHLAILRI